jgi:hypothetical protein
VSTEAINFEVDPRICGVFQVDRYFGGCEPIVDSQKFLDFGRNLLLGGFT